ncbi:MAG: ACT domain-containing protein [Alphaproteobacteria bacterium]
MADNALISYLGPDRPGLISKLTGRLFELGGSLGDVTFAALGRGAEMTLLYELPKGQTVDTLRQDLSALPEVQSGEFKVNEFVLKPVAGPASRITHRIILSGGDRPGLVARIIKILDEHGARVVRMNAERLIGATGDQYIARFAVSVRHERAPGCLAGVVSLAGELGLTFRYETA